MRALQYLGLGLLAVGLFACQNNTPTSSAYEPAPRPDMAPPVAKVVEQQLETHGHVRQDPYYWLNQREDEEVIAYLDAENAYTDAMTQHTEDLQDALFEEIKGRIKENDASVPYKMDDYYYYQRFEEGKEYPIYARKRGALDADEEIMLDVNTLAEGYDYYAVAGQDISAGQHLLAFAEDTLSRRIYTIRFKNLDTGAMLDDVIPGTSGNITWANDNQTLFYTKRDPQTLRSFQVYRHVLGTPASQDELVFEETDEEFSCFIFKTKSKQYLLIGSSHTLRTEYRYLDANQPMGDFAVIHPREDEHEYHVDHYGDKFYIQTNWAAKNFRLMETSVTATGKANWTELIPHRSDVLLNGFEIFNDFLVLSERQNGLRQIYVRPWDGSAAHYLEFEEPAYLAYVSTNMDFNTDILRYGYTSMTTPTSTFDYNMRDRGKTMLKQDEVLGDFDSSNYVTERLYATAEDGTEIPISLVYRKGMRAEAGNPLLLYGYGSYGSSRDASFSSTRLSLLDRGFVYAIAHIRGGSEMGRYWYEDGKLFKKMNTFTDFIACGEHLIEAGYADENRLFAQGGSAGGLLMGAVVNLRPDLFKGILAAVPFVDVVTTMLDDTIPLTTFEYDEWGNPNEKAYYDYMLSYSPYDNVEAKDYPHMLVTTGLHDSQVQYWEPAKWVAKLRAMKTDGNLLLLKTNMDAGHGGASGRFRRYEEIAFQYAFLLDLAGIVSIEQTAS